MKTTRTLKFNLFLIVCGVFLTLIVFISGCSESPVTNNSTGSDNLGVSSFVTNTNDSPGGNLLELTSAKLLIRNIKFISGSGENDFKSGPYVMYLDLTSIVNTFVEGKIPEGVYDRVKFEIHKPNNNEPIPDPDFRDGTGRYSVIVSGFFKGTPFTYKSKKSAHQFLNLNEAISATALGQTNVTLTVDPFSWFLVGGVYVDPNDSSYENDIDNNIKDSFKAIKDEDKNGIPD